MYLWGMKNAKQQCVDGDNSRVVCLKNDISYGNSRRPSAAFLAMEELRRLYFIVSLCIVIVIIVLQGDSVALNA